MNSNGNRFYLQALGVSGLFIALIVVLWNSLNAAASETDAQNASRTRTAIALTEGALLGASSTPTLAIASLSSTATLLPTRVTTRTLTPNISPVVSATSAVRTRVPNPSATPTPSPNPTSTPIPPATGTPLPPPTNTSIPPSSTPVPTDPPPTQPPVTDPATEAPVLP